MTATPAETWAAILVFVGNFCVASERRETGAGKNPEVTEFTSFHTKLQCVQLHADQGDVACHCVG